MQNAAGKMANAQVVPAAVLAKDALKRALLEL